MEAYMTYDGFMVQISSKHMKLHAVDLPAIREAIGRLEVKGKGFVKVSIDMGRFVGSTICVPTKADDDIVFARRIGRPTMTRFVKNREPVPCRFVTLIVSQVDKLNYRLVTGYVGQEAEREIGDRSIESASEFTRALKFWSTHALVWGTQPVYKESVTEAAPEEFA